MQKKSQNFPLCKWRHYLIIFPKLCLVKEELFTWTNIHPEADLEAIEVTLMALLSHRNDEEEEEKTCSSLSSNYNERELANYPDLVPRLDLVEGKLSLRELDDLEKTSADAVTTAAAAGPMSETFFLLAILLGTCILLYFFPPGP